MWHNQINDEWFLNKLLIKELDVTDKGLVTNLKTQRTIGAVSSNGYPKISLTKEKDVNGKWIIAHMQIHRLVWIKFNGLIPDYLDLNHIDGNKLNPSLINLELLTSSENSIHAIETGLTSIHKGETNVNAKFTREQVIELRDLYSRKLINLGYIVHKYNVSKTCALWMVNGKTYK